jgi:selT/selW/selH-like putative selenoprotein
VSKTFKALNPNIIITSNKITPRSGAFEITLNNKLVYSKFKTGSFPTKKEIENLIK